MLEKKEQYYIIDSQSICSGNTVPDAWYLKRLLETLVELDYSISCLNYKPDGTPKTLDNIFKQISKVYLQETKQYSVTLANKKIWHLENISVIVQAENELIQYKKQLWQLFSCFSRNNIKPQHRNFSYSPGSSELCNYISTSCITYMTEDETFGELLNDMGFNVIFTKEGRILNKKRIIQSIIEQQTSNEFISKQQTKYYDFCIRIPGYLYEYDAINLNDEALILGAAIKQANVPISTSNTDALQGAGKGWGYTFFNKVTPESIIQAYLKFCGIYTTTKAQKHLPQGERMTPARTWAFFNRHDEQLSHAFEMGLKSDQEDCISTEKWSITFAFELGREINVHQNEQKTEVNRNSI